MSTEPAVAATPKPSPPPAKPPPMELQRIPIERLHPSPHNPRHDFPQETLQQLASSINLRGIEQPLKARPNKNGFELIFGHRRLKAAQLAGLKEVPVLVQNMTDLQVAEAQLAENIDREDLAPLEVAGGYKRLLDLGQSMDKVCERSGRKRTQVYAMIQLLQLGPEGRKALGEGKVGISVAQLVASYPKSVQAKALSIVEGNGHWHEPLTYRWHEPLTYRDAQKALAAELMVDLKKAPFDVKAEGLPCVAKSCAVCPKRAGNQPELFPDVKHGDFCTDVPAYREKVHADAKRTVEAKGWKMLSPKEAPAEEVFYNGGRGPVKPDSGYLEPSDACLDDAQSRPYKELLPTEQLKKLVKVALDVDGKPRQLLERTGLLREVKKGGQFKPRKKAAPGSPPKKAAPPNPKDNPERYRDPPPDLSELVEKAFVQAMVEAAEKKPLLQIAKMVAFELVGDSYQLGRRRGLNESGFLSVKECEKHFGQFKPEQVAGLLFEAGFSRRMEDGDDMAEPAKALGVELAKVAAAVKKANPIRWSEDKHGATGESDKEKYLIGKEGKDFVFLKPKAAAELTFATLEQAKAAAVKVETGLGVWRPEAAKKAAAK